MSNGRRMARDLIESMGLTLVELEQNGRNHLRATVQTPRGRIFNTTFAQTPSDHRYLLNQRAWMRRKIRELDEPV
jgi:hypothetical protein